MEISVSEIAGMNVTAVEERAVSFGKLGGVQYASGVGFLETLQPHSEARTIRVLEVEICRHHRWWSVWFSREW